MVPKLFCGTRERYGEQIGISPDVVQSQMAVARKPRKKRLLQKKSTVITVSLGTAVIGVFINTVITQITVVLSSVLSYSLLHIWPLLLSLLLCGTGGRR